MNKDKAVWYPTKTLIESTRIYKWMNSLGYSDYESFYQASIRDVSWFWGEAEKEIGIEWFRPYHEVLDLSKGIKWPQWFVGGQMNVTYNAVEKWAKNLSTANQIALIWEGDDGEVKRYSFGELNAWIDRVACGLRKEGISKGDCISIYMPMIPETVVIMLAAAKIGAMFTPAFSGYGAEAVAVRLNLSSAKMMVTADGFLRRGKVVKMKEEADRAADLSNSIEKVVVVKRLNRVVPWNEQRDIVWDSLENKGKLTGNEKLNGSEPLMLLFTSGTTGKPKGTVHTHTGFPIKAAFDAGIGMNLKKGDVLHWVTDMGWMMGPFLLFAGFINGATIVLSEGVPDYPNPDRLWKFVEDHKITHLGISPTLIRSLMVCGDKWVDSYSLKSLQAFCSTGEPWNPEPWQWLFEKVGMKDIPILNYSGGTEVSGGILGNVLIKPISPITFNTPFPGMDAHVYNEGGVSVENEVGELVMKQPWVGMTNGFWQEPKRYEEAYWDRFSDTWVHGDWVIKDGYGYWTITGRSDDTLNIAGKRLGPTEVESILVEHPAVVEAGTIGVPDRIKGEVAVCFVVLNEHFTPSEKLKQELLNKIGEKLGKALKPKNLHFVGDLPKTRNAKVMRRAIKSAYLKREMGDLSALENPESLNYLSTLL